MKHILTIGYEGATLEDLVATLKQMDVDLLLDVRELPISRRKGFAKNALREGLESAGIDYQHEKALGSPKDIRHRLRDDNDYDRYFSDFGSYIDSQEELMKELADTLPDTVVLLCFERDHKICHRSVVAARMGEIVGVKPRHIGVKKNAAKYSDHSLLYISESLSAA